MSLAYRLIKEGKLSDREAAIVHALWLLRDDAQDVKASKELDGFTNLSEFTPGLAEKASDSDLEILMSDAETLVQRMTGPLEPGQGRLTAVEVVKVFARQALRVHQRTNCLTEIMIVEALREAQSRDDHFRATGEKCGPLHGLPVSLKDSYHVKGVDTSCGISSLAYRPSAEDGAYVLLLRKLGAVPFVKTNVPQLLMSFECSGSFWGASLNPFDPRFTPGGSSGGEGALLGGGGSAFGLGSDIGGSLRIPAHFSGCYAFRPTATRWAAVGDWSPVPGFDGVLATCGPMARNWKDLVLVTRSLMEKMPSLADADPSLVPLPWRDEARQDKAKRPKLRIGYYKSDGIVLSSPAVERAVQETVDALTAHGHICQEITLPNPLRGAAIWVALCSADGYATLRGSLQKNRDPLDPNLYLMVLAVWIPLVLLDMIHVLLSFAVVTRLIGISGIDRAFLAFARASGTKSTREYMRWTHQRDDYRRDFQKWIHQGSQQGEGFDCLVGPVQAGPAIEHGRSKDISTIAATTWLYNLLDLPVLVVPVTRVQASDVFRPPSPPVHWGLAERDLYGPLDWRGRYPPPEHRSAVYSARRMQGLPVGIQIIGTGRYKDEELLGCGQVVEACLGERKWTPVL